MAQKNRQRLLESKVQIPDVQKNFQTRETLLWELCQEKARILVFHATIGYGKTVLMSQYGRLEGHVCAWYHLDPLDNETDTFLGYFTLALERALEGFSFDASQELPQEAAPEQYMRELLVEAAEYMKSCPDQKLIMVLDDFQVLVNPAIFRLLEEFLDHMPEQFHFLAATKSMVPELFTKYLVRGDARILNYEKLRFSEEETDAVLRKMLSEEESRQYAERIWQNMEGWPAGIMFAVLYLRQSGGKASPADWTSVREDPMVQNYIAYELFKRLPFDLQNFLLKTSFAEELQPELCNVICGITNSSAILKYLLQEDMFIIHVGGKKGSYRYHSVFRGFLMEKAGEETGKEVCGKLARYYLRRQEPAVAAAYARRSGDEQLLSDIVEMAGASVLRPGGKVILRVSCFGKFRAAILPDDRELSWRTRKGMELFAYLLDLEGRPVERRVLLEQLWPDNPPNNSVAMLHNMIYSIRKELNGYPEFEHLIRYQDRQYSLDMSLIQSDLESMKQIGGLAEQGKAEELLAYQDKILDYQGPYLEEVDGAWCMARRAYFERAYGKACRVLARYWDGKKDYEREALFWQAYMEADRYSEEAVAGLLEAYGKLGERSQMKKVYENVEKLFREELGLEPGSAIKEIYRKGMEG